MAKAWCEKCKKVTRLHGRACDICRGRKQYYRNVNLTSCKCGCGELAIKSFVQGHHMRIITSEEQSRRAKMNTGDVLRGKGSGKSYTKRNGKHEHRVVMENFLGRALRPDEIVHHVDRNIHNNDIINLELMTRSDHIKEHMQEILRGITG